MTNFKVTIGNETEGEIVQVTAATSEEASQKALETQAAKNNPGWGVLAVATA